MTSVNYSLSSLSRLLVRWYGENASGAAKQHCHTLVKWYQANPTAIYDRSVTHGA